MDRIQRKAQQAEVETLKSTIENLKATIEARENEVAKLKHEVKNDQREREWMGILLHHKARRRVTHSIGCRNTERDDRWHHYDATPSSLDEYRAQRKWSCYQDG